MVASQTGDLTVHTDLGLNIDHIWTDDVPTVYFIVTGHKVNAQDDLTPNNRTCTLLTNLLTSIFEQKEPSGLSAQRLIQKSRHIPISILIVRFAIEIDHVAVHIGALGGVHFPLALGTLMRGGQVLPPPFARPRPDVRRHRRSGEEARGDECVHARRLLRFDHGAVVRSVPLQVVLPSFALDVRAASIASQEIGTGIMSITIMFAQECSTTPNSTVPLDALTGVWVVTNVYSGVFLGAVGPNAHLSTSGETASGLCAKADGFCEGREELSRYGFILPVLIAVHSGDDGVLERLVVAAVGKSLLN